MDPTPAPTPVEAAFAALRDALATEALTNPAAFDRATGYRKAIITLADRWSAGVSHAPRAPKGGAS